MLSGTTPRDLINLNSIPAISAEELVPIFAPISAPSLESKISALHTKYSTVQTDKKLADFTPLNHLQVLLDNAGKEKKLIKKLEKGIREYAREHLNQIGTGDNFTVAEANIGLTRHVASERKSTKPERAAAVSLFLDMVGTASASEIYAYIMTPNFQRLIGAKEVKFNFLRIHLAEIFNEFTKEYEEFLSLSRNDLLIKTLTDLLVINNISVDELQEILLYYNTPLVAEIILDFYADTYDDQLLSNELFHKESLIKLRSNDAETIAKLNIQRSKVGASLVMPAGAVSPGKNLLQEEGLDLYQLYQYEDDTIYAVEKWLRDYFPQLLANNIEREDGKPTILDPNAPYYFYLVSAAEYILVDPASPSDLKWRYEKFRKDIRSLVESYDLFNPPHNKPLIICGIINIDGVHYLPYFIFKSVNGIHVYTIDPSAPNCPSTPVNIDAKYKTQLKLRNIFNDIFPEAEFQDADVAQMLRERDCGPNSATTLYDAFATSLTSQPLFSLDTSGVPRLDTYQLSVKFKPIGINPYTNMYVFPAELDATSLANRATWKERLSSIQSAYPLTVRSGCDESVELSIHDVYKISEQTVTKFKYDKKVQKQQRHDLREINLSAIRTLLMGTPEGAQLANSIISSYESHLILPSTIPLEQYIKSKYPPAELNTLTQGHNNLTDLVSDFIGLLLKDHIPSALISGFKKLVLDKLPKTLTHNARQIVTNFLDIHKDVYQLLTIHQQRVISEGLLHDANVSVKNINLTIYIEMLREHFTKNGLSYFLSIPEGRDGDWCQLILAQMKASGEIDIADAIDFLLIQEPKILYDFLNEQATTILKTVIDATVQHVTDNFDYLYPTLSDLLTLFTADGSYYQPLTLQSFSKLLPMTHDQALTIENVSSLMSEFVIGPVNKKVNELAIQRLQKTANESVKKFLEQPAVISALEANQNVITLTEHVHASGKLLPVELMPNLDNLIVQYGSELTLTQESLRHTLIGPYIKKDLTEGITKFYSQLLQQHYHLWIDALFQRSDVSTYIQYFDKQSEVSNEQLLNYLRQRLWDQRYPVFFCNYYPEFVPVFQHFATWFALTIAQKFEDHFDMLYKLKMKIINHLAIINGLRTSLNTHNISHLNDKFQTFIDNLQNVITRLDATHLSDEFESNFKTLDAQFNRIFAETINLLLQKNYIYGNVKPDNYTTIVRRSLCQLLTIDAPPVLTMNAATELDNYISSLQYKSILPSSAMMPDTQLLQIHAQSSVPVTYGKPLNREIILSCIAYWQTQYNWQYSLTHYSLWFNDSKEPNFIQYLITIVNDHGFDEEGVIIDPYLSTLRKFLHTKTNEKDIQVYQSSDITEQIKAALLRTSTMINTEKSQFKFSTLSHLFNLKLKSKEAKKIIDVKPQPTQQEIQKRTMELVRDYKKKNPEGGNPDLGKIKLQVEQELKNARDNDDSSSIPLFQVDAAKLARRSGFFSTSLFAESMTKIETILLQIQSKHAPLEDFLLDEDDIQILVQMLASRWQRLLYEHNQNEYKAYCIYVNQSNRSDKVYIALAEMISRHYRDHGKPTYIYQLLMPNCKCFGKVKRYTLAPSMAVELGVEVDQSNVDDIPLTNLVITRSGYALDIQSIIELYERTTQLTNPYTKANFTNDDLSDICAHPKGIELFHQIEANYAPRLTDRALDLLVRYLNAAVFDDGFDHYLSAKATNKAFKAYTQFQADLMKLSKSERDGLLKEPIPLRPAEDTIGSMFEQSEVKSDKVKHPDAQFKGGDICLNNRASLQARVVLAYRGNHHGLTNEKLVRYARNGGQIPLKRMQTSPDIDLDKIVSNISKEEEFILNLFTSRSNLRAAIKM